MHPQILFLLKQHPHPNPSPRKRRRGSRVPQFQRFQTTLKLKDYLKTIPHHFQTTCVLQTLSKLPPPPWGRAGERAKQLPHKPTFPQPQQTLSLTLSRRRGNRVPEFQRFQTTPKLKGYLKTPYVTLTVNLSCWVTV